MNTDNDIYYRKYLKYKLKYFNLLESFRKKKIYIDDNLNDILDNNFDNTLHFKNQTKITSSDRTVILDEPDSYNSINVNKILNLKNKIDTDLYKIIAHKILENKKDKTENEKVFFNKLKDEVNEIMHKKLSSNEIKLLNNLNKNELINIHQECCNNLNDDIQQLIKNETCIKDEILDKVYLKSEHADDILRCPENSGLIENIDKYLNLNICK